jgi:putative flippase GtrA
LVAERVQRLLAPEAGLLGQGARFVVGGCATAVVYLLSTTLLALVAGLPFEVALAIGFCLTISFNFSLQRMFVWVHDEAFALPLGHQLGRYLSITGAQYGLTAASIAVLPRVLGLPTEVVYLATAVALAAFNFIAFRHGVFHAERSTQSVDSMAPQSLASPARH